MPAVAHRGVVLYFVCVSESRKINPVFRPFLCRSCAMAPVSLAVIRHAGQGGQGGSGSYIVKQDVVRQQGWDEESDIASHGTAKTCQGRCAATARALECRRSHSPCSTCEVDPEGVMCHVGTMAIVMGTGARLAEGGRRATAAMPTPERQCRQSGRSCQSVSVSSASKGGTNAHAKLTCVLDDGRGGQTTPCPRDGLPVIVGCGRCAYEHHLRRHKREK